MKKQYCAPVAYNVYGENLLGLPDDGGFDFHSKGGDVGGETGVNDNNAKDIFVWDDDFDGEDDNWGYSGF